MPCWHSQAFQNRVAEILLPLITLLLDLFLSLLSDSNTNAKKWETELQTLRENNARLVDALQESSANVESWKKQLSACKEESDTLRKKVIHSCTPTGKLNNVDKPIDRGKSDRFDKPFPLL